MATQLQTYRGDNPLAALLRIIGDVALAFAHALRATRSYERLRMMSDAQLARRGIVRADIARVAFETT